MTPNLPNAPAVAIVKPAKAKQFNAYDVALYSGMVAYRVGDYITTERGIQRGAEEVELPQGLVKNKGAFLAYSIGMAGAEIAGSYWLHRHGHARLARVIDTLAVSAGVATDIHNSLQ